MSAATFALAGNPNSGKTTLFNSLTGGNQHVGNYPGVTVEKKEGFCIFNGKKLKIVDIPGTYSLTAYSLEEKVARDFLVNEKPAADAMTTLGGSPTSVATPPVSDSKASAIK